MKFSVVIPVYNGASFVERAMISVLEQTHADVELIVINDGSTDDSERVVSEVSDRYPHRRTVYRRIENSGPSTARNAGIELASGDYICFLDSDDMYDTRLFAELDQKLDGEDICFFGWEERREGEEDCFSRYSEKFGFTDGAIDGEEAAKRKFRRDIWLCNCNEVYSRSLLVDNGIRYLDGVYSGEDCNFIYKCLVNAKTVTSLAKDYFINIERGDSLMHAAFSERSATELIASGELYGYAVQKGLSAELCDMFFSLHYGSRAFVAKRIARSLKWHNFVKFSRMCKRYIPKIKKERKVIASREKKFENFMYSFSKPLFLIMCRCFYRHKAKKVGNG
ncbi:MAG: glycosyltransferase family 2 protein [Roseburia sp.]|nr:glycosyltransferase family 2 protein [Roseburia sp.]